MTKAGARECAVMIGALAIVVGCASWIAAKRTRGAKVRRVIENAVDAWEAEGGAVVPELEEA